MSFPFPAPMLMTQGGGIDSFTTLMLHCDDTTGPPSFTDSSSLAQVMTAVSSAQPSTAQHQFGTGSMLLGGSGQWVYSASSANYNFGAGDFTIDLWVRFASLADTTQSIFSQRNDGASQLGLNCRINGTTAIRVGISTNGTSFGFLSDFTVSAFSTATWYHVAVVRSGNNINVYKDGVGSGNQAFSGTQFSSTAKFAIGTSNADGATGSSDLNGNIDEFRVSKGIARWTTNFTPPTVAYF